jgi:hypothetical protein
MTVPRNPYITNAVPSAATIPTAMDLHETLTRMLIAGDLDVTSTHADDAARITATPLMSYLP